jgi:poly-gamma-glutamate capsule biosynthesis protein CapA/YwtB (metallophosphatase superfamily)
VKKGRILLFVACFPLLATALARGTSAPSGPAVSSPPRSAYPPSFARCLSPDTIENFDDGIVRLGSFPGQDVEPDSWRLDSTNTCDSSRYSLKLLGNTWKTESIAPRALDSDDVWQAAAYVQTVGEIQGFGLSDSAHTLLYSFAGTELLNPDTWVTVYQGAFPNQAWNVFQLPVGQDWLASFGYPPTITGIVFVNDRDSGTRSIVYFDEITDITHDLPIAPEVQIWHDPPVVLGTRADNGTLVEVQFHSRVNDPDSREHQYFWHFGDDSTSRDSAPRHTYLVHDDHEYTVLLEVDDSTNCWGRATCGVTVDPGPTSYPLTMNFVGDIILARRYDTPGGLIDTLGVNAIFDPTLPCLGNAADITVANLECPLTARGTPHPTKPIVFRGRPRNVAGLAHAGIDVVSQANNHVIDYGLIGMRETQDSLVANGIRFSGAGADAYEAYQPLFYSKSGVNVAFLAFCNRTGQYDNLQPYLNAGFDKPGFAELTSGQLNRQLRAVEGLADLRIIESHSGIEYSPIPPADDAGGDEFYAPFAHDPSEEDIALRHQAIDSGADLVINHHPHLLQGFEVYRGKLIAHSLGNFVFDLDYPETFATAILTGKIDASGFYDFSITPTWIDRYIPRRATGELGCHILDDLALRSRALNTYLAVDRDSVCARIILDTVAMTRSAASFVESLPLTANSGHWQSEPGRLARQGSIAEIASMRPQQNWEYRLGRELVWFGNFEDEGSTMWLLNQTAERYDTVAGRGRRSLRQDCAHGSTQIVTNLLDRLPCPSDSVEYSLHGQLRTQNAQDAGITARFYASRTGSTSLGSRTLDTTISGLSDWGFYSHEFTPAPGTAYLDICLQSGPPASGTGNSWFDDAGVIQWDDWQPWTAPIAVAAPNDIYWIQVRTTHASANAELTYREIAFNQPISTERENPLPARRVDCRFRACPNPARLASVLSYGLVADDRVSLKIYNALGREIRNLVDGRQTRGSQAVIWDGRDDQNRLLSAGTYFCRLRIGQSLQTRRVILLR